MRRCLIFALLTTMFVGCVQDKVEEISVEVNSQRIYATINTPNDRVQLNESQCTTWTEGDRIVVQTNAELAVYQFDGNTGDRSGSFTKMVDGGTIPNDYKFNGKYYAIYPYEAWNGVGMFSDGTPAIFATIPSVQSYLRDSYGLHTNIMLGSSDDGQSYQFKNLLSYLCLNLSGEKMVKSIELIANGDEYISGTYYFDATGVNGFGAYSDVGSSITLDCGDGVQLSETPTKFYFTLPPIVLKRGFTIIVNFTDGEDFMHATSKEVVMERNTILPMKAINTAIDASEYQWAYIYHTGVTVSVPYTDAASAYYINWGDGQKMMSTSIMFSSYDYSDNEESHVVTVRAKDATTFTISNCKGISKIDLSNF